MERSDWREITHTAKPEYQIIIIIFKHIILESKRIQCCSGQGTITTLLPATAFSLDGLSMLKIIKLPVSVRYLKQSQRKHRGASHDYICGRKKLLYTTYQDNSFRLPESDRKSFFKQITGKQRECRVAPFLPFGL